MKKATILLHLFTTLLNFTVTTACPTCIGRLNKETPLFFTSAYDAYLQQNIDADSLINEQNSHEDTSEPQEQEQDQKISIIIHKGKS